MGVVKRLRPLWVGEGNMKRISELLPTVGLYDTIAVALQEFEDGELFIPFGDGMSKERPLVQTSFGHPGLTHLSLAGMLKKLTDAGSDPYLFGVVSAHVGKVFRARHPLLHNWEAMSHEQVLELLRDALRRPEMKRPTVEEVPFQGKKKKTIFSFSGAPSW